MEDVMLSWKRRRAGSVTGLFADPWRGVGHYYLGRYRASLERIACALTSKEERVWVRFNAVRKWVEFYTRGQVLAQVIMHGERGHVYRTIVRTELGETERAAFATHLPCIEFEDHLSR